LNGNYGITPMLYDIQAIQYLYGANMSYHTGADTYAFAPMRRCNASGMRAAPTPSISRPAPAPPSST
jgi:hypothetical protein